MNATATGADPIVGRLDGLERSVQALVSLVTHGGRFAAPTNETPLPAETPPHKLRFHVATDVLDTLDDAIWSLSPDGTKVYSMNGGVERTFGRAARDFHLRPGLWFDVAAESDRDTLRAAFHDLPFTESFDIDYAIKVGAGQVRWVKSRGKLIRGANGVPQCVNGITTRVASDRGGLAILEAIGSRTGAEFLAAAVQRLAEGLQFRAALVAVPHPANVRTAQALAVWLDGRHADPFTFSATGRFVSGLLSGGAQYIHSSALDRYPGDELLNRLRAEAAFAAPLVAKDGRLLGFVAAFDDRSVRGSPPDARATLRALAPRIAVELDHRLPTTESLLHAEELTRAEARSEEAARFEMVGRLMAGSAHDFANLLTVASGHAELLRDHIMDSALRESIDLVVSSSNAAGRVARQLLSFARPHVEDDPTAIDPNATIAGLQGLLASLVGKRIDLSLLLTAGTSPIRADRTSFERVVVNLVGNAKDAIEDTGSVEVRTANVKMDGARKGWPGDCPPGDYVAITVADTGCGMTDDVKARAFTKFFTTKGARGTGLGLSNVLDLVRGAGGHVELDSSTEWGTRVRVYWPAAAEPDEPASLSFEAAMIRFEE